MRKKAADIFISVVLRSLMVLMFSVLQAAALDHPSDVVQTSQGPLRITPIYHASVMLEFGGKVIYIDPSRGDFSGLPQADLILITHTHGDHLDKAMMEKLKKPATIFMGTPGIIDTINCHCKQINVIAEGQTKTEMGIGVEAVAMYNAPKDGSEPSHHRGIGSGFVLSFGDTRVYLSGDTDCVPEMKSLKNLTVAFVLGMNTAAETAQCVKEIRPKIFYPYHYGRLNTQEIAEALKGTTEIEVRLRKLEDER